MAQQLAADFLGDEAAHAQAERFWADLWARVLREAGAEDRWRSPWLNTTCVDGTRMRGGDPIFSAIRDDGARAVRVVQFAPRKPEAEIWTNVRTFDPEGDAIQLLEVFCSLPQDVEKQAHAALLNWVMDGASPPGPAGKKR